MEVVGQSSGGRTGGWEGCSPPRGPNLFGAGLQSGPKMVNPKKTRRHAPAVPLASLTAARPLPLASLAAATCDARCAAPAPLYRRHHCCLVPRPALPLPLPSPRGRHRPPLLHLHASADRAAAPTAGSPGQRGRPAPSRQPASQRPAATGQARRGAPTSAARPASGQHPASQPYCPRVTQ